MSNQLQSNQTTKTTIRINKSLLEQYDEHLGEKSRSEDIRQHIREVVGEPADGVVLPSEPLLRDGFEAIRKAADAHGIIPCGVAKSRVSEATRVDSDHARRTVIEPLVDRGYLTTISDKTDWGKLRVNVGRYE
jgi:hypothetical protein